MTDDQVKPESAPSDEEAKRIGTWDAIPTALAFVRDALDEIERRVHEGKGEAKEYGEVLLLAAYVARESAQALRYAADAARDMGDDPHALVSILYPDPQSAWPNLQRLGELIPSYASALRLDREPG